jgi:hypothetical protein
MLFKCSEAELQTSTFLAGVDALKRLDDWKLRHRILAFLLLIKTSAFREGLKGQAHLSIEPLVDLVERFRVHDATDSRDKIYALWGLCSDSSQMEDLRPDYNKTGKELREDFGKIIFGERSSVTASSCRQMMFVRAPGYDVGKIEQVLGTDDGRLWESTQKIRITSAKVSRIGIDPPWSVWIKVRIPSEQLLENDFVFFLPHASQIVFARPARYYFRILTATDSRTAQVFDLEHEQFRVGGRFWQSWIERIDEDTKSFPLLWSWEKDHEQDEKCSLELVNDQGLALSSSTEGDRARILSQATAASDIVALLMESGDYYQASILCAELVPMYDNVYGGESEVAVTCRNRLSDALNRDDAYLRAYQLLERFLSVRSEAALKELCTVIIIQNARFVRSVDAWIPNTPAHVGMDLASKVISRGVSKAMLLEALQLLPIAGDNPGESTVDDYSRSQDAVESRQDYVEFLLDMTDDDISISASELLNAARRQTRISDLVRFAERSDCPLQNLPEILEAVRLRRIPGFYVEPFVTDLGDRIVVTADAINVAAKWDAYALSALLDAANGAPVVLPDAFTIAMQHLSTSTRAIINLLAQNAEIGCVVPEEVIKSIAYTGLHRKYMVEDSWLDDDELKWIFVSLLEHTSIVVNVSEEVFLGILEEPYIGLNQISELLRFRSDSQLPQDETMSMLLAPYENDGPAFEFFRCLLESTYPVRQDEVDSISANDIAGYASFINLVRYRQGEFRITEHVILKVVREEKKKHTGTSTQLYGEDEAPWKSMLIIEKCAAFLIKHADDDVIDSLVSSSALVDTAAHRGFPRVIETVQSRSNYDPPHLDTLRIIAELCQLLQQPFQPGESFTSLPEVERLLQSLAEMAHESVSENVKLEMVQLARHGQYGGVVIEKVLENGILDASAISPLATTDTEYRSFGRPGEIIPGHRSRSPRERYE